jgi:SAM-dependent methyltransferase
MTIDEAKLNDFIGSFAGDLGAVLHATTVLVGDRLGLYKAMADGVPVTPAELAARTGYDERYLTEWLSAQAASGYAVYADGAFHLTEEQAFALSSADNAFFAPGGLQVAASTLKDYERTADAIREGRALGWGDHDHDLYEGTDRFFRPGYVANLVSAWLPALDGVVAQLEAGVRVADVGCGQGSSTILMAQAYPQSTFVGIDPHEGSVEAARKAAADAGVADRAHFEVAGAKDYPGEGYDLVTLFDCLHDMGDPVGALTHIRSTLAPGGTVMIVEPNAGDRLEDNLNPIGRIFYSVSTTVCVPASKSQEVGLALGAQAGEARTRWVAEQAGLGAFRRATETPFNAVYEARA